VLDAAEARTQRAMQAIAAYIARHPLAADNEAGIAQWWLAEGGTDVPLENVKQALARLVQQQVLLRTVLPDGSAIYRAGPAAAVP
jgi:molecular chaperone DnaK (HSP70)